MVDVIHEVEKFSHLPCAIALGKGEGPQALEAWGLAGDRASRSRLLDPCWTKFTISKQEGAVAVPGSGISMTCMVANPDVRTLGIRIPARDAEFT